MSATNGVTIVPYDDREFRLKVVQSFIHGDNPRSHEIHFTDMINCLFCSFMRKIIPEAITEEKYNDLLDWMRGLAFDTKITDRFSGKARVIIGKAMGHVDMMFPSDWLGYSLPYELTSTPFLPRDIDDKVVTGDRYRYKVEQLKLYMAALCIGHGRLKIIQMVNVRKKKEEGEPNGSPQSFKPRLQTREHTYDVFLTPLALATTRYEIVRRQAWLGYAMRTGNWRKMPRRYRPILPDAPCVTAKGECSTWRDAVKEPKIVTKAWETWRTVS